MQGFQYAARTVTDWRQLVAWRDVKREGRRTLLQVYVFL